MLIYFTNYNRSMPAGEDLLVVDNAGGQITSGAENVVIPTPLEVIDNGGSLVDGVTL